MDNAFAPGASLATDYLAGQLGVSRTPIRKSLPRLASEGLLVKRPMAGYSVCTRNLDQASHAQNSTVLRPAITGPSP